MLTPSRMSAAVTFCVLVTAMLLWHFWDIGAAFYFLFAVHFLEFVFAVGDSFDEYYDGGFDGWH